MKGPWCLATTLVDTSPREVVRIYCRRFQCEETFRDLKDRRYGYGLRFTRIKESCRTTAAGGAPSTPRALSYTVLVSPVGQHRTPTERP